MPTLRKVAAMLARMPEYAVNIIITLTVAITAGLVIGVAFGFPHLSASVSVSTPSLWGMIP